METSNPVRPSVRRGNADCETMVDCSPFSASQSRAGLIGNDAQGIYSPSPVNAKNARPLQGYSYHDHRLKQAGSAPGPETILGPARALIDDSSKPTQANLARRSVHVSPKEFACHSNAAHSHAEN
jgi:hypothetical protein